MNVYLIGLPGSGKSTLGKELAQLLGLQFTDTDDLIVQNEKATIETIFKEKGEAYFREAERKVLQTIASQKNLLVATGGGLPSSFNNMEVINHSGISVFLDPTMKTIISRLKDQDTTHRPLLAGKTDEELFEFLENKYQERIIYYNKARFIFTEENLTAETIAEEIKDVIK